MKRQSDRIKPRESLLLRSKAYEPSSCDDECVDLLLVCDYSIWMVHPIPVHD